MLTCSCSSDSHLQDLQQFVSQIKQSESNKPFTAWQIPTVTTITYQASSLRSPFQDIAAEGTKKTYTTPLQAYPLTTLRFTGTVIQPGSASIAYVLTPDNMVYQVKEGDPVGDHDGKVTGIRSDRLIVTEQDTENNKQETRVITLRLKDTH